MMAKSLNGLPPVRNVEEEVPLLTNPILLLLGTVAVPLHPMQTHVPLPLLNPRTLQMPCCPSKHPHYGLPWRSTSRRCSGAPQPSWGPPVQQTGHYGRRLPLSLQFRSFLIHSSKEEILDLSTMQTRLGRKILCSRGGRFSRHETKNLSGIRAFTDACQIKRHGAVATSHRVSFFCTSTFL
jgi:hypothetical protein